MKQLPNYITCAIGGVMLCFMIITEFYHLERKRTVIMGTDKEIEIILTIDSIRYAGSGENTKERMARVLDEIMELKQNR